MANKHRRTKECIANQKNEILLVMQYNGWLTSSEIALLVKGSVWKCEVYKRLRALYKAGKVEKKYKPLKGNTMLDNKYSRTSRIKTPVYRGKGGTLEKDT